MPHDIDINDGVASFVSAREDAWHHLGITLEDVFTAEEAMQYAHLGGWNLRKLPVQVTVENGTQIELPGRFAVVRDNPVIPGQIDALGDVGQSYHIIQNEEHAEFLNTLVDESGAHFETAGALDGGRQVFITMKLPGYMKVGGVDQIDHYIAAINSHDGGSSFMLIVSPVRIVCRNTLNAAIGSASNRFRIRHTRGAKASIQEAREKLDLTFDYLDVFQQTADQLINTTMTQVQFEEIVQKEFGADKDAPKAVVTRAENKIERLEWLFAEASTQAGIANTAWAGFNALTEWFDHYAPTRGDDRDGTRAKNAVMDYSGFKARALELVKAG